MDYSQKTVETSLELLKELLEKPVVDMENNEALVSRVRFDQDVISLWKEVIEPVFQVKLITLTDKFYLTTGWTGGIFGYSNEEMRRQLGVETNRELYLCSFIVLTMLAAFYDSEDSTAPARESMILSDLQELVSENLLELGRDEYVEVMEDETRVNLREPAEFWLDLPYQKSDVDQHRRSKSQLAYLLKTMDFLQKHGLVRLVRDRQVFPEERLHNLVSNYYNNVDHKNEILETIRFKLNTNEEETEYAPPESDQDS